MSDIKMKRAPRESVQSEDIEAAAAEPVPSPPPASPPQPALAPAMVAAPHRTTGADNVFAYGQEAWAALAEAQAAAARSFDALIGSSAKLSEIGVKAAADTSRQILTRLGSGLKPTHFG